MRTVATAAGFLIVLALVPRSLDGVGFQPTAALMTRWAGEVTADRVLPEYPRPELVRHDWQNLNGPFSSTTPAAGRMSASAT
jgi:hypothetical protein